MSEQRSEPAAHTVVAVIDIGASAIRMTIAQVSPAGEVDVLETPTKPVAIGRDVFTTGRVSRATRREAIEVLKGFKELMETYRVTHSRVIATSALREAADRDTFVDWVYVRTGLDIEVIEGIEENQQTFSAVQQVLGERLGREETSLIIEVGGGSTELVILRRGDIALSQTLPLGPVRMQQRPEAAGASGFGRTRLFRRDAGGALDNIARQFDLGQVSFFVALGGEMRFLARMLAGPDVDRVVTVKVDQFQKVVRDVARLGVDQIVDQLAMPFAQAETLFPSLIVYSTFLEATGVGEFAVPMVSIRDGLLAELAAIVSGRKRSDFSRQVVASAREIGRKYQYDEKHANQVARLSLRLFDELAGEHTLGGRERLLLEVAAILHDIGMFISNRAHHKHSAYVVRESDIFGLRRPEKEVLADVVRYHRKATPQPTHVDYMSLPRADRVVVSKLAAILRVADALDRAHLQRINDFTVQRGRDSLILRIRGVDDLSVERSGLKLKGDLFDDVFGMGVQLEEVATT